METTEAKFSKTQLNNWWSYEKIRRSGKYNMFDRLAQIVSGLTEEEYFFCIDNYSLLKRAFEAYDEASLEDLAQKYHCNYDDIYSLDRNA